MRKNYSFILMLFICAPLISGHAGDRYASPESSVLINKMIKAHGGELPMHKLRTYNVHREQTHYRADGTPGNTWYFEITANYDSRQIYQSWFDGRFHVGWDGTDAWFTDGWMEEVGFPPRFTVSIGFYLSHLPWFTQDPGVHLSKPELVESPFPGAKRAYNVITMTFDDGIGDTPNDSYRLFIDPETSRLKGCEMFQTYGAMLDRANMPASVQGFRSIFVVKDYQSVNGFLFPQNFTTYRPNGSISAIGVFKNVQFGKTFTDEMQRIPKHATIDQSSPKRQLHLSSK